MKTEGYELKFVDDETEDMLQLLYYGNESIIVKKTDAQKEQTYLIEIPRHALEKFLELIEK